MSIRAFIHSYWYQRRQSMKKTASWKGTGRRASQFLESIQDLSSLKLKPVLGSVVALIWIIYDAETKRSGTVLIRRLMPNLCNPDFHHSATQQQPTKAGSSSHLGWKVWKAYVLKNLPQVQCGWKPVHLKVVAEESQITGRNAVKANRALQQITLAFTMCGAVLLCHTLPTGLCILPW